MGTKVIDKLRVRGSAAHRHVPESKKLSEHTSLDFRDSDTLCPFILRKDGKIKQATNSTETVSHPSSAASQNMEFLHRVKHANTGLISTNDYNDTHSRSGNPNTPFILRGKTVCGDYYYYEPNDTSSHQRVGHFQTSEKEINDSRNNLYRQNGYSSAGYCGVNRPERSAEYDVTRTMFSPAVSYHTSGLQYHLSPAPITTIVVSQNPSEKRLELHPSLVSTIGLENDDGSRGSSRQKMRHTPGVGGGITPLGQNKQSSLNEYVNGQTSYIHKNNNTFLTDGPIGRGSGQLSIPKIDISATPSYLNLVSRRRHLRPRATSRELSTPNAIDPARLKQCLKVNHSNRPPRSTPAAVTKLRHLRHKQHDIHDGEDVNSETTNLNTPYRHIRTRERKTLSSDGRYLFNSVESYIHFNKIYPCLDEHGGIKVSDFTNPPRLSSLAKIPKVDLFSATCTDAVLLKMMFHTNTSKRGKSPSKYPDVALHNDLDEFMIVRSPILTRSTTDIRRKADKNVASVARGATAPAYNATEGIQTIRWTDQIDIPASDIEDLHVHQNEDGESEKSNS